MPIPKITSKTRYSELDYLRVFLILAVFLHHVLMPFNGDDWHVMNQESSQLLDDIMVYFEQLRLPTLFFVAGAGSILLLQKVTIKAFIMSKFHRLFVPFIVGMLIVVPPQNYFENIHKFTSLIDGYQHLMLSFDANHLWFIEFLIVFMSFAIPVYWGLNSYLGTRLLDCFERLITWRHGLFVLVILLSLVRNVSKWAAPSQDHSIENISVSFFLWMLFLLGMCCMSRPSIWRKLAEHRQTNLFWFALSTVFFYGYYFGPDIKEHVSLEIRWQIWWLVCTWLTWSGLLVLVGYASACSNHTPKWLQKANELIFPFYILHQTVIVVLAFYIVQWPASIALKSLSLLFVGFLLCSVLCYFVDRVAVLRYCFGLKPT